MLHTDQVPNTGGGHTPWIVTDGGSGDLDGRMDGSLQTTWYVNPDDSLGASFQLTASGLNSGEVATTAFTDAAYTITTDALWSSLSPTPTSGDTVVIAGGKTLTVDSPTATIGSIVLGNSTTGVGTLRFNAGSALTVSSSVTIGNTTLSTGLVDMASGGTLKVGGALTNPYGSLTAGTGTVEYNGGGAQTAAALTYNHLVHSGAGTLTLNSASPLTVTGTFTNSAGTFDINGNTASLGSLSLTGGTVVDTAPTKGSISATSSYAVQAGTISASLGGVASLTKTTSGTAILSGANTYTGTTTISAGVLNIQQATALGTTAAGTTVASGAALQLQGGITVGAEALTLNGTGVANDGALRNLSGTNTFGGLITLGSAVRINSDAGSLAISNTGTITGSGFGMSVGGSGNVTISSFIGTAGGTVTKDGSGVLTLTAANTYSGATTVNQGTLTLSGANGSALNTAFTVAAGGVLTLDNTSTNNTNRLSDTAALTLAGGELAFQGSNTAATTAAETVGALTLPSAASTVTAMAGTGGATTLTFASVSRTAGATVLFRGNSLGASSGCQRGQHRLDQRHRSGPDRWEHDADQQTDRSLGDRRSLGGRHGDRLRDPQHQSGQQRCEHDRNSAAGCRQRVCDRHDYRRERPACRYGTGVSQPSRHQLSGPRQQWQDYA